MAGKILNISSRREEENDPVGVDFGFLLVNCILGFVSLRILLQLSPFELMKAIAKVDVSNNC